MQHLKICTRISLNSGGKVGFLVHCRHKNVMDVKVIMMMMIENQVNRAGQVKTNC